MKNVPLHAVKICGTGSDILNVCVKRGDWLVRAPVFLPPEKEPPPYIEQEAGWFREPVLLFGEEKNLLSLAGFYVIQLVA
jgi:hypothetical protein